MIEYTRTSESAIGYGNYVLYFTAAWCGPCKALKPQIQKLSKMTDTPIFVIDVDEADPGVVDLWKVQSIPTLFKITSDESVTRLTSRTADKLLEEINA